MALPLAGFLVEEPFLTGTGVAGGPDHCSGFGSGSVVSALAGFWDVFDLVTLGAMVLTLREIKMEILARFNCDEGLKGWW